MITNQKLLVEGKDDQHIILNLCKLLDIPETFKVIDCEGVDNLLQGLSIRLKSSETTTIGVVIDADVDMEKRWQTIRKILTDSNYYEEIPSEMPTDGLVLSPDEKENIKFGLWIMPDNQLKGMIEDFMAFLIPENDILINLADEVLEKIEINDRNKYPLIHHAKARIHTWLAWQEDPGTPMGQAITKKYLSVKPIICQMFINWLNRLFN